MAVVIFSRSRDRWSRRNDREGCPVPTPGATAGRGFTHLGQILAATAVCLLAGADWLHFRGTDTNGVSQEIGLPITFSEAENKNVAWKVPLPGRGPSSPIVVDGRVVVTAASGPREDRLHVLCFDAASGDLRWERQLWATGSVVCQAFGGVAAPSPASDGRRVFAFFSSNDLACFDLDGSLRWYRGLGYERPSVRNDEGMASSPLVLGQTVIVQLDTPGDSFVAGIDADTGETRWQIQREKGAIWASPTVLRGSTPQDDLVLLQSRSRLSAHRPENGELVWNYEAPCHTISSVTTSGDCVYLPAWGLHALRSSPDRQSVDLLWYYKDRFLSSNPSPVAHDGKTYTIQSQSILTCGDAAHGRLLWRVRLEGPIWATPVLADGRLYCVNEDGLVQVVALGQEGSLIGTSQLDSPVLATPAVADGAIYFRSNQHLWKIASKAE